MAQAPANSRERGGATLLSGGRVGERGVAGGGEKANGGPNYFGSKTWEFLKSPKLFSFAAKHKANRWGEGGDETGNSTRG